MPSEKAKENKTLVASCTACGKTVSTELVHAVVTEHNRKRVAVPVCDDCRRKGWQPAADSP